MKNGFYLKLAVNGMRKNRKVYLPYLLACIGIIMMYYLIAYLSMSEPIEAMRGGRTMTSLLGLGKSVIAVFAVLFLAYTNAFLRKRRNREFGLYNILGMTRKNLSRIMAWESVIIGSISVAAGIICGIVLSKLAELGVLHFMNGTADFTMRIDVRAVIYTVALFAAIFAVLLLISLGRIGILRPLELMRSEAAGEKPPKGNAFIALAGLVLLAAAYYISITITDPLSALTMFFVAVIMVIAATYLLFIAGSVTLCRILQKNKGYYYRKNHFVSVSQMAYRMKRNGAGLASICILSTMILVMVSSTSCLVVGGQDGLKTVYPYDYELKFQAFSYESYTDEVKEKAALCIDQNTDRIKDHIAYTALTASGTIRDGVITVDRSSEEAGGTKELRSVMILPYSDYYALTGEKVSLSEGEALVHSDSGAYEEEIFRLGDTKEYMAKNVDVFGLNLNDAFNTSKLYVFIPDEDYGDYCKDAMNLANMAGAVAVSLYYTEAFNIDGKDDLSINESLIDDLDRYFSDDKCGPVYWSINSKIANIDEFFSLYGSLFFLGILLSIVFLFGTVLIIYYKQVTEGYEDQSRFEIMRKVGMTDQDIRSSINSQVMTVFAAPLVAAGLHLAFAFPMIWQILHFFGISNLSLLIMVTAGTLLIFAVIYAVVYKLTSNAYYRIVNTAA